MIQKERVVLAIVVAASCARVCFGADPPFEAEFEKYLVLPDVKAFAVAIDASGSWACGYGYGSQTIEHAEKIALAECEKSVRKHLVEAACEVIALGKSKIKEPNVPHATGEDDKSRVTYEVRWVNGTSFVIGSAEDLQLWVAFTTGRDPQALLYLVNGTSQHVTFSPESIRAIAVRSKRKGVTRTPVNTFSATEYEKKVRTKQA